MDTANTGSVIELASFDINPVTGFMPRSPLQKLPPKFEALDDLAFNLPNLIAKGAIHLRRSLDSFPLIDASYLEGSELMRARMIYGFAQSAYVKIKPETNRIPECIAIPSHLLSSKIGRDHPPILNYASDVLTNWKLLDENTPFQIYNLTPLLTFTDSRDEKGFISVHVLIEYYAAMGLRAIEGLLRKIIQDNSEEVFYALQNIKLSLKMMYYALLQMPARCSPDVYYRDIRPWSSTFIDVVYEGIEKFDGPQTFRGASGAQSSILPSFDAALGISHRPTQFFRSLLELRLYMPPLHRAFIEAIEDLPPERHLRNYILERKLAHPELVQAYNECLVILVEFRKKHLEYLLMYLLGKGVAPVGTGGTSFMEGIEGFIEETSAHII